MKRIVKILAVVLVVTLSLVLLCGCSTYNKLSGVCNKEGYKEIGDVINYFDAFKDMSKEDKQEFEEMMNEAKAELKESGLDVNVYMFLYCGDLKKDASMVDISTTIMMSLKAVVIVEFKSTDELKKQISENEAMKDFIEENGEQIDEAIEDVQELPFVNGNCVFFAISGLSGGIDSSMMTKLKEA